MKYFLRTFFGFGLIVFSWFALGYGIYQLLQVGTCASGGPYVSARQCPPGTGGLAAIIPGAVFAILGGGALYAARGKAPGSDRDPDAGLLIPFVWTGLFWSIAVGALLGIFGPHATPGPGAKTGGLIVAILFIPMGAGGLLGSARSLARVNAGQVSQTRNAMKLMRAIGPSGASVSSGDPVGQIAGNDPIQRLERLQQLRETGTVTDAEFERLKGQILNS